MRTFDWSLFGLYNEGHISYEEALHNADSANELRLNIKFKSSRGEPGSASGLSLALHDHDEAPTEQETLEARQQEMRKQKELHAEKTQQQEKRIRQEDEQLAILRKAKQPLELQSSPAKKVPGQPIAPGLTVGAV